MAHHGRVRGDHRSTTKLEDGDGNQGHRSLGHRRGDLERTLDFYRRLGFTIAWEKRPGRPDMATIRINDAQKINVHGPDAPAHPAYLGACRPTIAGADFCLEWEGSVDEVLALLEKNGVRLEAGPTPRTCARGTSTSVYLRDPDDNLVEFTVHGR